MKMLVNGVEVEMSDEETAAHEASLPSVSIADYRTAIQAHLNRTAKERGYEDGHTIATYLTSTVEAWAAEAQSFIHWRDAVWVYAFGEMAKVEAGERSAPTVEDFIGGLPPFEWPP